MWCTVKVRATRCATSCKGGSREASASVVVAARTTVSFGVKSRLIITILLSGNESLKHAGNLVFSKILSDFRGDYARADRKDKRKVLTRVLETVASLDPPARFLRRTGDGRYFLASEESIIRNVSRALREKKGAKKSATPPKRTSASKQETTRSTQDAAVKKSTGTLLAVLDSTEKFPLDEELQELVNRALENEKATAPPSDDSDTILPTTRLEPCSSGVPVFPSKNDTLNASHLSPKCPLIPTGDSMLDVDPHALLDEVSHELNVLSEFDDTELGTFADEVVLAEWEFVASLGPSEGSALHRVQTSPTTVMDFPRCEEKET